MTSRTTGPEVVDPISPTIRLRRPGHAPLRLASLVPHRPLRNAPEMAALKLFGQ